MKRNPHTFGYVPELNGLRGLAIIGVMGFHGNAAWFDGGFIGVDIFFVLSGFLITTLLINEFDEFQSINLKYFYMRRVLRLAPALVAMLLSVCLFSFVFMDKDKALYNYTDAVIALFYLSNWAKAFGIHPPNYIRHTWSLSIEEQFYVIWPILLLILLRKLKDRRHVAVAALSIALLSWCLRVVLCAVGATADRLYDGLDTRADGLMLGCALGIVTSSGLIGNAAEVKLKKSLFVVAPSAAIGLVGFGMFSRWNQSPMLYLGYVIVELFTSIIIFDILVNRRGTVGKVLSMHWLVWLGTISYGLYLWHYPVYRAMRVLGYHRLGVITLGSLITLILSAVSYYYLEKPILGTKKRFTRGVAKNAVRPIVVSAGSIQATDA